MQRFLPLYKLRPTNSFHPVANYMILSNSPKNLMRPYSTENEPPPRRRLSLATPIESMLIRSKIVKDVDLARFISKTAAMTVYSFAGITVLGTLGVDTKPIIAGIGVTGFTVGFALKEIAANLLAGILLMFQRPFHKGQYLKVLSGSGLEGEVESIDSRYVLLKSKDKGMIMIPSSVVYSNPILVFPKPPADAK